MRFEAAGRITDGRDGSSIVSLIENVTWLGRLTGFDVKRYPSIHPSVIKVQGSRWLYCQSYSICNRTWSHTSKSCLKPIKSLIKRTLKTLDKKTIYYHYCKMTNKCKILDQLFKDVCLIYQVLNGLAPPPTPRLHQEKKNL